MAQLNDGYMVPRAVDSVTVLWKMMKTKMLELDWVMSSRVTNPNPNRSRKHVGFTTKTYRVCQWLGRHFVILLFHAGSSTTHPSTACGSLLFHSMLHMFKNFGMRLFWMSHAQSPFAMTQYLLWYVYCFIQHLYLHTSRSSNGSMTGGVTLLHMHIKLSKLFLIAMRTSSMLWTKLTMWSGQSLKLCKSSTLVVTLYLLLQIYFRICGHLLRMAQIVQ